ncbi:MAG: hypothetical protein FJ122_07445 [Deltaproteobacteria bacterium]|nr:hypothetical protein [Deltaproteobacteria bacterium]
MKSRFGGGSAGSAYNSRLNGPTPIAPPTGVLLAVVTNPTRHWSSGFFSGAKGTSSWWAQA